MREGLFDDSFGCVNDSIGLLYPLAFFWAAIFATIALYYGSKACRELNIDPQQKGKGMFIFAIVISSIVLATVLGFLGSAIFYYGMASMEVFYIVWAIVSSMFFSLFLFGFFSKKKEKKPEKNKEELQVEKEKNRKRQNRQ